MPFRHHYLCQQKLFGVSPAWRKQDYSSVPKKQWRRKALSSFFPSSSSQGTHEVGPFPKVMSNMEELYVVPQRESQWIMKDWGHARLENDCIVQKLIGWFKQNEHEATVCFHTQNTELILWWRDIKQMLPDLPWGHPSSLWTADLILWSNITWGTIRRRVVTAFAYPMEIADDESGVASNFRILWMFVHSRTVQESLSPDFWYTGVVPLLSGSSTL